MFSLFLAIYFFCYYILILNGIKFIGLGIFFHLCGFSQQSMMDSSLTFQNFLKCDCRTNKKLKN